MKRQLTWWGHLQKMTITMQIKKVWVYRAHGKRKRGAPKQTWDNIMRWALNRRRKTWPEEKRIAQDRKEGECL